MQPVDQDARVFVTGAKETARSVQLEAPPHQRNTIGQQRRGHRVTGVANKGLAVEAERKRPASVYHTATW